MTESLGFLLQQIYTGPFNEHVVRNMAVEMDSALSGRGFDCDGFRRGCESLVKGI